MARRFQSNFAFPGSLFGTVAFCAINSTMPMRFHSRCFSPELSAMALKLLLSTGDLFSKFRGSSPLIQFALEYRLFGDHKNTRLKRRLIAIVHGFCRIKSSEDNYSSCGQNSNTSSQGYPQVSCNCIIQCQQLKPSEISSRIEDTIYI